MAETEKQNFRYPVEKWRLAVAKTVQMREAGYDIDMTMVLVKAVDQLLDESTEATARRLGIRAESLPVEPWRKPFARDEVTR